MDLSRREARCAFSTNPRVQTLADGTVRVPDCDLEFSVDSPPNWFDVSFRESAFAVFEFSLANYHITLDRPQPRWDWIGLPPFVSKALGAFSSVVNVNSGIQGMEDLRFGIPACPCTAKQII
jgi:hypothetical protein